MRRSNAPKPLWRTSPEGIAAYREKRAWAQAQANATGLDYGISGNDLFKEWTARILPAKKNRYGHELQCEVVSCEDLSCCQPGHGP